MSRAGVWQGMLGWGAGRRGCKLSREPASSRPSLSLSPLPPCSFKHAKGGDFGLVHPAPLMKGLLSEDAACDDLASVLHMVPERSMLCVWTQDSHAAGKSVLLPYTAVTDIDMEVRSGRGAAALLVGPIAPL